MITKCQCQWCDATIEFEASEFQVKSENAYTRFGQTVECPNCAKDTMLAMPRTMMPKTKAKWVNSKVPIFIAIGIFALTIFLFGLFGERIGNAVAAVVPAVGGAIGGILLIIFSVLSLTLAIFWIIFPVMVYIKLRQIEANTRQKP